MIVNDMHSAKTGLNEGRFMTLATALQRPASLIIQTLAAIPHDSLGT